MRRHSTRHGPYQNGVSRSGKLVHVLMDPPHRQTRLHSSTINPMFFTDEQVNCPVCLSRIASRAAVSQWYANRAGESPRPIPEKVPMVDLGPLADDGPE